MNVVHISQQSVLLTVGDATGLDLTHVGFTDVSQQSAVSREQSVTQRTERSVSSQQSADREISQQSVRKRDQSAVSSQTERSVSSQHHQQSGWASL